MNLKCSDLPHKSYLSKSDCDLEDDAHFFLNLDQTYHGDPNGILKAWFGCLGFPKTSQSIL